MQTLSLNYYEVLGVPPQATLDEIKAAYRVQLDAFRAAIGSAERPDGDLLIHLRKAFATLGDPAARQAYDDTLAPGLAADSPPQAPVGAVDQAPPAEIHSEGFRFVGTGGDYFRIWIVNLCLSLLTLGIYSAWAKVRREQYFHRNLLLDGSGFDYHGQPKAILKGRAIAFGLLMLVSAAQHAGPLPYLLALALMLALSPWLAVRAMRFRALNTSYRGLHFSFDASYRQAAKVIVGYGLLALLSLGILLPRFVRELRKFVIDHSRFGTTPFACEVSVAAVYRIYAMPMLAALAVIAAGALLGFRGFIVVAPLVLLVLYVLTPPYLAARTANAVWSASRLGGHGFVCTIPVGRYIGVTLLNWLAIVGTLGLFIPWARVRIARLRAEHLTLECAGSLDDFVARESERVSALGDEAAEMFDLDIAL